MLGPLLHNLKPVRGKSIPAIRASTKSIGRETNQQKRIASGVKNGKLTPKQTAHLERREHSIQNQQKRDMARHGGHLTKAEQTRLNQRQNRVSKTIYKDKHSK